MRAKLQSTVFVSILLLSLTACSKGGNLTLEPGARVVKSKGTPFLTINDGGKALLIESGKTVHTGVHGWATVQSVTSRTIASPTGVKAQINNPTLTR